MKTKADELFQVAIQKLNQAKEESYRPEEDVVTYLVCKNAQFSMEGFLKGFLMQHEVHTDDDTSLESLFEKCKAINKGIGNIDLQVIDCKSGNLEASFCNHTSKACDCLNVSVSLEAFLKQERIIM